ncbi:NUDIX hydrolase [Pseudomonas sp. DTU_2021_1001937_2_SI_NGA_ILE_001]|uniref:NUDIX hydrolase n=1 Tax=Pseudomonas sp. DTU_2021_1001937_2_SI_NGA_ILE_001 TaxID=3077589 RepID=UPI0028FC260F|nr:NUDIX hydrolase [Pseudomonas sp. DTU_2021_1001937_2_SI_NGA_ILE_001]WNW10482.1 NUDIX hydrolase [Pseudomonas sp. DTU_2021_1001937_2_SI_NGA_ILE_001]
MKVRATVICKRDNQILYVRKPKSRWNLPGGKIEAGETPEQAALRELSEETGLEGLQLRYLNEFRGNEVLHHVFITQVPDDDQPRPLNEISACKWLAEAEIDDLKATSATRRIIRSLVGGH